ncbi:MAG: hypothetical protein KKD29_01965 [Candidatus Omnitrophica bacterium]|nr:hypothetical protein [Candidatus Omnitrophota bacterium]MBU4487706.1 hypothetical protein [Candidatus Omnitrophota bacterium]MCG2705812.1 hypothetical protein [Candidatus Omnitrophota bacterium]
MKQLLSALIVAAFVVSFLCVMPVSYGESNVLKEGLLGAGAGAVGGWASGAKSKNVWKGALAGAGVNVVGNALLDSSSNEHVATTNEVQSMPNNQEAFSNGYKEGYNNGYKQGYVDGLKDGHSLGAGAKPSE